jgi:hypothetical protein
MAAVALLASSLAAHADSIVLDSVSGDTYTYGIEVAAESSLTIAPGEGYSLTGLFGVTGATSLFCSAASFTSTSFTETNTSGLSCSLGNGLLTATEFPDLFTVTSSSTTEGLVSFDINGDPSSSGTVEGPVAAVTPEPESLVLLGTGLLGVVSMVRRRKA